MVTNSNRQPIANTRRTHSESTAQFHLTRIDGNCWKGTAKEHTGEMGLANAGETRGRMHGNGFVVSVLSSIQAFRLAGRKANVLCTLGWEAQHQRLATAQHDWLAIPQRTAWHTALASLLHSVPDVTPGHGAEERRTVCPGA